MKLFLITVLLLPVISFSKQLQKPEIYESAAPTNVPISQNGTGPTCYFAFKNPKDPSAAANWGFTPRKGWTNDSVVHNFNLAGSCTSTTCAPNHIIEVLSSGITYYFAAQEVDETTGAKGRWSNEVACTPPADVSTPPSSQAPSEDQNETQE